MPFYHLIIRFLRLVIRLYFVEIRTSGRERVPGRGPVMLAANHPSSVLDPFLLATQVRRTIHYLARSGLFRYPVVATFFRQLGAIPVYRAAETQDSATRNAAVFAKVYELFEAGGCVGIFPEGRNSPYGYVGELRTGGARMALAAEARNHFRLDLTIVPVGITYEHRELLMSAVLVRYGEPIRVADYAADYRRDPERAIKRLTADLQAAIRRETLHIEDRRLEALVKDLSEVLGHELAVRGTIDTPSTDDELAAKPWFKRWLWKALAWYRRGPPPDRQLLQHRVRSRQHIGEVLASAAKREPAAVEALRTQLERYKAHLRQTELREALDQAFDEPVRQRLIRLRMTLYAVCMAPVALFGLVHNVAPYLVAKASGRLVGSEATRAFTYFGVGVLAFLTAYALYGVWLWRTAELGGLWTLAYLALLPPTGLAALHYRRNLLVYRDRILLRTFFWDRKELVQLLREERRVMLRRFQELADRHVERPEPVSS